MNLRIMLLRPGRAQASRRVPPGQPQAARGVSAVRVTPGPGAGEGERTLAVPLRVVSIGIVRGVFPLAMGVASDRLRV
jgi:hypothetical protein